MIFLPFLIGTCCGLKLSKENANSFLRARRANEGYEEYYQSGSLERECFEETCDSNEFHEAFDDFTESERLLKKFIICENQAAQVTNFTESIALKRNCFQREENATCVDERFYNKTKQLEFELNQVKERLKLYDPLTDPCEGLSQCTTLIKNSPQTPRKGSFIKTIRIPL